MSERPLNADLAAVEAILAGLVPAESSLGRDRVMYLAGRASARPAKSPRLWQATTLAATLAACALGVVLWTRPEPQVVIQRIVVQPAPPDARGDAGDVAGGVADVEPQTRDDVEVDPEAAARRIERTVAYLRTWRALAIGGLDALPSPPPEQPGSAAPAPRRPETLRDLIDELQRNM